MVWVGVSALWMGGCDSAPPRWAPESADTPARAETSGVVVCADPSARAELGPVTFASAAPWTGESADNAGGVSIADLNGDGGLDVFLPLSTGARLYLRTDSGGYLPVSVPNAHPGLVSSAVDLDADGDLELVVAGAGADTVWWNEGGADDSNTDEEDGEEDSEEEDLDERRAVLGPSWRVESLGALGAVQVLAWDDVDADGDLDLFAGAHTSSIVTSEQLRTGALPPADPSSMLLYEGGSFASRPELIAATAGSYVYGAEFYDLDGDGRRDLYVTNDFGPQAVPNLSLLNGEDGFYEAELGLNVITYGMGTAAGDLDDDGLPDFLISGWDRLDLMESRGGWHDSALARGLIPSGDQHVAWGNSLADVDNDGDLDAFVTFGQLAVDPADAEAMVEAVGAENPAAQSDGLWLFEQGSFEDVTESWGLDDPGVGRGVVLVDLDRDGFLDFFVRNLDGPSSLFMSRCDDRAWLSVSLEQPGGNRAAIGAIIDVETSDRRWRRWLTSGTGSLGTGPAEVHVGLGDAQVVDVRVTWPDGATSLVEGVDTRQQVKIIRE